MRGHAAFRIHRHSEKGHCMSYLTDEARAPYRRDTDDLNGPDSLEAIVAGNPSRRSILRKGLLGLSVIPAVALAGRDDDDSSPTPNPTPTPQPTPTPTPTPVSTEVPRSDERRVGEGRGRE